MPHTRVRSTERLTYSSLAILVVAAATALAAAEVRSTFLVLALGHTLTPPLNTVETCLADATHTPAAVSPTLLASAGRQAQTIPLDSANFVLLAIAARPLATVRAAGLSQAVGNAFNLEALPVTANKTGPTYPTVAPAAVGPAIEADTGGHVVAAGPFMADLPGSACHTVTKVAPTRREQIGDTFLARILWILRPRRHTAPANDAVVGLQFVRAIVRLARVIRAHQFVIADAGRKNVSTPRTRIASVRSALVGIVTVGDNPSFANPGLAGFLTIAEVVVRTWVGVISRVDAPD